MPMTMMIRPMNWAALAMLATVAFTPAPANSQPQSQRQIASPLTDADAANAVAVKQLMSTQAAQAELIEKLLGRLDQLERTKSEEAQRAESIERTHEAEVRTLQDRINELEGKVGSGESGKVLPKIAVSPKDGPTANELDQKIRVLERNNELSAEAAEAQAAARAKESPRITAGPSGFAFSSADTNFVLKLKGLLQVDSRRFFDDSAFLDGNDGFYIRRARPIFEGTFYRDFDFNITPDFGGNSVQLFDAWINYRYQPALQLRVGKFKGPVGFENLQSDSNLPFNERSLVSNFVPSRNVGLQLWGDIAGGVVSYAAGVFNAAGDGRNPNNSDFNDNKEIAGRLSFQPLKNSDGLWQGFGFGAGGSYSDINSNSLALPGTTGGTLPGYVTSGLQQFFAYNPSAGTVSADGVHWRISPYAYYTWGPFGVLGEYITMSQGVVNTTAGGRVNVADKAWQVSAQWVLTGEDASFNGVSPKNPFDVRSGKWGAWQLVARFAQADLDQDVFPVFSNPAQSAYQATAWSVGLNWWLNRNIRVLTSYSQTWFDGGGAVPPTAGGSTVPPAAVTHQDEKLFTTRLQLAF